MKNLFSKKNKISFFLTLIFMSLTLCTQLSCTYYVYNGYEFYGDLRSELIENTKTTYTFYAFKEDSVSSPEKFSISYSIGDVLSSSDLPDSSDSRTGNFYPGYDIKGWKIYRTSIKKTEDVIIGKYVSCKLDGQEIIQELTVYPEPLDLVAVYEASKNTTYTVKHMIQNLTRDDYELYKSQLLKGTTETETKATALTIKGFTPQPFIQETILADGSTEVYIYYDRNRVTVTIDDGVNPPQPLDGYYEEQISIYGFTLPDRTSESLEFEKWNIDFDDGSSETQVNRDLKFPASNATCTAVWKEKTVDSPGNITNPFGSKLKFKLDSASYSVGTTHTITITATIDGVNVSAENFASVLNPSYKIASYGTEVTGYTVGSQKNTIDIPATFGYGIYTITITGIYNGSGYSGTCDFSIE